MLVKHHITTLQKNTVFLIRADGIYDFTIGLERVHSTYINLH